MSRQEAANLIRQLKDYVNLSYESEATIAKKIGVGEKALNGWLCGKSTPTFKWLLKLQELSQRQPKSREGIAPVGYRSVSRQ
jgi:RecA-family ATPase